MSANNLIKSITVPLLLLIIWSLLTYSGAVQPFFLPSPTQVLSSGYKLLVENSFLRDIFISLFRIVIGFLFATILALPVGILLGLNKTLEKAIEPTVNFIRYTPIPAFIPLLILWLGIGETEKIFVIAISVFFQLILMVAVSVSLVPKEMVLFAKTLGATKRDIVTKVILPHSLPRIVDDIRINFGLAWSGLLLAEIVGSSAGIGYVIIQSQRLLRTGDVIFCILVIGLLGLVTDLIFKWYRYALFPWSISNHD